MCSPQINAPCLAGKRTLASVSTSSDGPKAKKIRVTANRGNKSVQFSTNVNVRRYEDPGAASPGWVRRADVDRNKQYAKALSKLHNHILSKVESEADISSRTIGDAVRCEIGGESLRGMEHATDAAIGRKRRRVRDEAMQAAVVEQKEQLILQVLNVYLNAKNGSDVMMMKTTSIDSVKLAKVYGSKTREALDYAKSVAEEDAEVAASILAEDLQQASSSRPCSAPVKKSACINNSVDPGLVAEIIRSYLPATSSKRRSVVSVQA